MSIKTLLAFLPLIALCAGQSTGLDNTQELSPLNGTFTLSWSVIPDTGDIVIQIQARTVGWVSLTLETSTLSDVIIGGFNSTSGQSYVYDMSSVVSGGSHGPLVVDSSLDVLVQKAFEYPPEVVIRYKRSLNTEDSADVAIVPGPMTVSWGISGGSDSLSAPLAAGGVTTVTFIPL